MDPDPDSESKESPEELKKQIQSLRAIINTKTVKQTNPLFDTIRSPSTFLHPLNSAVVRQKQSDLQTSLRLIPFHSVCCLQFRCNSIW